MYAASLRTSTGGNGATTQGRHYIWFPTFTFFAIGLEHSVVNMYLFPAAVLAGAPVTWGQFLWHNLLPVTLGNTVAGAFFVGMAYWFSAGMPLLGRAAGATPEQYGAGSGSASAKVVGRCGLATFAFAALVPGIPALLVRGLLEGGGTLSLPAWGAALLKVVYMAAMALLLAKVGTSRPVADPLPAPSSAAQHA